ncbi:alpha-amylase family glycosyl hydrolase [Allofournierella sp.]|uniref:alpha-amylase family glycosyl hydrolase n=1 Tax=Allofournierella sp. TaxID=1940256 RepID=UPI003AF0C788
MWFNEACIYQIYPLGLCGAPAENDGIREHRILRVLDWAEHIRGLNMTAVLFNPVFESDRHGYDTRDFFALDCRLGTNEDFAQVCDALHAAGLKVILDGVFNHVGRGFWAFRDVQQKKWDSPYKDWFHLDFNGDTQYGGDGFWYEGWEGHNELVKLNLQNPAVVEHLLEAVRRWAQEFEVDGLRLDVAYSLPPEFLARLRRFAEQLKPEFALLGETLHGDYNRWMNDDACHSVTNYECYKGLWSSFNSGNMFEIGHSLARQFGPEPWTLYRGKHLLSFLDNHDVERIASMLTNPAHLRPAYGLLFGMPGVPAVYYGSEWGIQGKKSEGDAALRPALEIPRKNELTDWVAALAAARQKSEALRYGNYRNLLLTNAQIIFERAVEKERVLVAVNAAGEPFTAHFDAGAGCAIDLVTGLPHDFGGGSLLEPYSVCYWQVS